MKVTLIAHTPCPEKLVAAAAKLCYSDSGCENIMDGLTEEKTESFVKMLSDMGHESPIEHASFTFAIEGVSRTLLAQITRHRLASFSVQSQRYVKKNNFVYITPPAISEDKSINEMYEHSMQSSFDAYNAIADKLEGKYFNEFLSAGMSEKQAHSKAEKKAIEDARYVLPNSCETKMVVTMNARSLMNFFKLRCCMRAQWEIRELAEEMYRLCYKAAPSVFSSAGPPCCSGGCPEGKMTCGKINEVRDKFQKIKESL
ncbi:FAD-dependent thymidylate synthase [Porcipelethomonas sp.]|uniref:FAD-dependent thymidylate synthase n=1 Tax=Porcipelethomonas sp. TaxID=2981675 RepID=UPI003EF964A1